MGVIARYREHLPIGPATPEVDLSQGSTPLVPSRNIGTALGLRHLYFKYEGLNPTGSFKDRGMVVAVAKALEAGSRVFMCASTGNTSASMAAYAARTGARAIVVVPSGEIALNKLSQALMYGAKVVALKGNFDHALETVRDLTSRYPVALMNSVNPHRIEGQKTAAFEVVDALGDAPDYLVLPVGNAGNITAYWKGFKEYHAAGRCTVLPRMVGAQAEGAAPIVSGRPVAAPRTVASAIEIGNPASWGGRGSTPAATTPRWRPPRSRCPRPTGSGSTWAAATTSPTGRTPCASSPRWTAGWSARPPRASCGRWRAPTTSCSASSPRRG